MVSRRVDVCFLSKLCEISLLNSTPAPFALPMCPLLTWHALLSHAGSRTVGGSVQGADSDAARERLMYWPYTVRMELPQGRQGGEGGRRLWGPWLRHTAPCMDRRCGGRWGQGGRGRAERGGLEGGRGARARGRGKKASDGCASTDGRVLHGRPAPACCARQVSSPGNLQLLTPPY